MSGKPRTWCKHCRKGSRLPNVCPHCGAEKKKAPAWRLPREQYEKLREKVSS